MKHSNIVKRYNKAQMHFDKGNFRRAKWLFRSIVYELSNSDSDSMSVIYLYDSAEKYLYEINKKKLSNSTSFLVVIILIIILAAIFLAL